MKTLTLLSLILLGSIVARADDQIKTGEENPKTYTLDKFTKEIGLTPVQDELVCLKFNMRNTLLTNNPDGSKTGVIESRYFDEVHQAGILDVIIPVDGLAWFQRIPTSVNYERLNAKSFIVYARVSVADNGTKTVRLVGNEIKHDDFKGDSIIWHSVGS